MKVEFPRNLLTLQEIKLPLCDIGPADAADDLISKMFDIKLDRCPTCRGLLAHRGGAVLPCHNPKCPENPKNLTHLREEWSSMSPNFDWHNQHPGYEFAVTAYQPNGKRSFFKSQSLPKARAMARMHHQQTGERVEVSDQQGRKFFTLSSSAPQSLGESVQDELLAALKVNFPNIRTISDVWPFIDWQDMEFQHKVGKRYNEKMDVVMSKDHTKRFFLPSEMVEYLIRDKRMNMRSLKKYVNSRW